MAKDMKSSYPMPDEPEAEDGQKEEMQEDDGSETSLLPKSMFTGEKCNVGDKVTIEIVGEMEDGYEVKCVPKSKDEMSEGDGEGLQDRMMAHMNSGK